jgi:hypothetical protein
MWDLGFSQRFVFGLLIGVMVSAGLAAAYVFGGGINLVGTPNFSQVDSYAFSITLFVGSLVPLTWLVFTRDISTAAGVALSMGWSMYFGLEDAFVYLFYSGSMPAKLPWLNDSLVGQVASFLGFDEVTRTALYIVIVATGIVLVVLARILYEFEYGSWL